MLQEQIWESLYTYDELWSQTVYATQVYFDEWKRQIDPIHNEQELRSVPTFLLQGKVKTILHFALQHEACVKDLSLHGKVTFGDTTSFREPNTSTTHQLDTSGNRQAPRNTRADQFCIQWNKNGEARPLVATEYKAPHKVTIEQACTGLDSDIVVERDILGTREETPLYLRKYLMTAVITQLFSYMIDKGVRYGYVCTGEALVFIHIQDDLTKVYYSVSIPKQDFEADEAHGLERTAVA